MADDTTDPPAGPADDGKKKKGAKKGVDRQKILVGTGIAGVIIAILTLRRMDASNAAATPAATANGFAGSGTYAPSGYGSGGGGTHDVYGGLNISQLNELSRLEGVIAAHPNSALAKRDRTLAKQLEAESTKLAKLEKSQGVQDKELRGDNKRLDAASRRDHPRRTTKK
jgi:hypothetical protein